MTSTAIGDGGMQADVAYVRAETQRFVVAWDRPPGLSEVETHRLPVRDGRRLDPPPTLSREGFLLAVLPSDTVRLRLDDLLAANAGPPGAEAAAINQAYAAELVPLVRRLTGAREVLPQDGTLMIRFSDRATRRSWIGTSAFAHLDFAASEVERLVRRTIEKADAPVRPFSRHLLIQTWRPITPPPQDRPLILLDATSVAADDMIPMEFNAPAEALDPKFLSRVCRFSPAHRWVYFPDMTPDEVLVFEGFDSARPASMNVPHSTTDDTTAIDPVPRGSIECRFVALFD